jgi:hypothetical protein
MRNTILAGTASALLCLSLAAGLGAQAPKLGILDRPLGVELLADGTYLVTDGGGALRWDDTGSEVMIVDRAGAVLWDYSEGLRFAHSAIMLRNGNVLIPDTNDNRLVEADRAKRTVWTSESWPGGALSDGTRLDYPNHIQELEDGHWLVSDRDNSRIVEIDRGGAVYRTFRLTKRQHAAISIGGGRYLVSDSEANRVLEFDESGAVLWSFDQGLAWPRCVERLESGNYLITDSNNNRVIEVTPDKRVVSELKGPLATPYEAHRLPSGNTLVCDAQHGRVLELDPSGAIVWKFGDLEYPKYPETPADPGMEKVAAAVDERSGVEKRSLSATGWYVSDMVGHGWGSWSVDRRVFRAGSASLRIDSPRADGCKRAWGQRISVAPGRRLNLFVGARTALESGGAGLGVTWYDALGATIGGSSSKALGGEAEWTTLSLACVAPQGTSFAELSLSVVGKGSAWFDELQFGSE